MSAYEYAFTLTPGRSSRARSLTIACAAIAAEIAPSGTDITQLNSAAYQEQVANALSAGIEKPLVRADSTGAVVISPVRLESQ